MHMRWISDIYKSISNDAILAGVAAGVLLSILSKIYTWLTSRSYKQFWLDPIPVEISFHLNKFGVALAVLITLVLIMVVPLDSNFWLTALVVFILVMLLFATAVLIALLRPYAPRKRITILSATYLWERGGRLEVTDAVRKLVQNGVVTIVADPSVFGIPDPARGVPKTLHLHWKVGDEERAVAAKDGERFHLI